MVKANFEKILSGENRTLGTIMASVLFSHGLGKGAFPHFCGKPESAGLVGGPQDRVSLPEAQTGTRLPWDAKLNSGHCCLFSGHWGTANTPPADLFAAPLLP